MCQGRLGVGSKGVKSVEIEAAVHVLALRVFGVGGWRITIEDEIQWA